MIAEIFFLLLICSRISGQLDSLRLLCNCETPVTCHTRGYFVEKVKAKTIVFNGCENLTPSVVSELYLSWASKGMSRIFHDFRNLRSVTISQSVIRNLTAELFSGLHHLEKLILNRNDIKELSDFAQLENLRKLFLASNSIAVIKGNVFRRLTALTFLTLEDNEIFFIHSNAFAGNLNLEELNLNRNDLSFLEPTTFHNNLNLKEISLNHNKLKGLPAGIFVRNEKLEVLRMFRNELKSLHNNIFDSNMDLRWIELGENELLFVDSKTFQNLQQLHFVDFSRNYCIDGSFPIEMNHEHLLELIKRNCHYLAVLNNGLL